MIVFIKYKMSWMSSSHKNEVSTEKLWTKNARITDLWAKNIVVGESIVLREDDYGGEDDEETIDLHKWREMKEEFAELRAKYERMEQEFQAIKDQLASRKTVQADLDAITESIMPPTALQIVDR